jgi:hypothetical protein
MKKRGGRHTEKEKGEAKERERERKKERQEREREGREGEREGREREREREKEREVPWCLSLLYSKSQGWRGFRSSFIAALAVSGEEVERDLARVPEEEGANSMPVISLK